MPTCAVLLTSYNRKETTLRCLRTLAAQQLPLGIELKIYLVDDASPDGTGEAVNTAFPNIHLVRGTGQLYWGGGMRRAFAEALKSDHEFFLWLNDDVELLSDAIVKLMNTYSLVSENDRLPTIVVGATCDPRTQAPTYAAYRRKSWNPLKFDLIRPDVSDPISCDTMNGNIVLIPKLTAHLVGNIDQRFRQRMGDLDYGLRARKAGVTIWLGPGFIGTALANPLPFAWKSWRFSLLERLRLVSSPLGMPFGEWMTFAYRHGGVLGVAAGLFSYRELFFPKRAS